MTITLSDQYPIDQSVIPSARSFGRTVTVTDESYVVQKGDLTILLRITDSGLYTLDFGEVQGDFSGQVIRSVVVEATGSGSFTTVGLSPNRTLDGSATQLVLLWNQQQSTFKDIDVVPGGQTPWIDASDHGVLPSLDDNGPPLNALLASVSAGSQGNRQTVYVPPGIYKVATTISHPPNVDVVGAGRRTVFRQSGVITLWDFQSGFLRLRLASVLLQGQGDVNPNDYSLRVGTGIDFSTSQQIDLVEVEVWDFLLGINLSDGTPFASYLRLGPRVEVNRCTTGIRGTDEINASSIVDSRIFFSYGNADEGIGIDLDDPEGFRVENVAIEAADTCVRVRSTSGLLQARILDCFLEPGTNPVTTTVGSIYDIDIASQSDGLEVLRLEGNVASGNNGNIILPPEGFMYVDTYSRAFFGARYDGAAVPKRNLVRNGTLNNWALPDVLPNWAGGGLLPTLAQDQVNFVTGVRSMRVTAPGATGSTIAALFTVSDPGVEWVTCGVRYRVLAGNVGFFFTGSVGGNNAQLNDPTPTPSGEWETRWVQVRVNPANRNGSVSINPDSVNGTGSVLIDEVWVVPGRYAIPSSQFGERIEMLPAPIVIVNEVGITSLDLFGPIDITDLPALLSPPLSDFSAAPEGVVGGVFRLAVNMTGFADATVLGGPVYAFLNIPGSGATTIPASVHQVMATFGQTLHNGDVLVRGTSLSGGCSLYTGLATDYSVALVAWVMQ